jgi:hypothetical protein
MYKYRRILLYLSTISYIVLTIIELVKYLALESNLYGLIYLIMSSIFLFLLIPTTINYKNNYSMARFSKLLILVVLGIFNSFILNHIVFANMKYLDSSYEFLGYIRIIKNVLKPVVYFLLLILTLRECKLFSIIKKIINKSVD